MISTDLFYFVQCFASGILKNKRINKILPQILVLVIPDYVILHLSVLLYSYCEHVEREIYTTGPLRDLDISTIFGVRYTDLRGLPSGILFWRI